MFSKSKSLATEDKQLKQLISTTLLSMGVSYIYIPCIMPAVILLLLVPLRASPVNVLSAICGVIIAMIFTLKRGVVNPFKEYWFLATGNSAAHSIEQRKVFAFLKKSKLVKKIIIGLNVGFIILLIAIALSVFILNFGIKANPIEGIVPNIILACIYMIFMVTVTNATVFRYIIIRWSKIQSMNIEPWPSNKPYMPKLFSKDQLGSQQRTIFASVVENQDKKLNCIQTVGIFLLFIGLGLMFLGWAKDVFPVFGVTSRARIIIFMVGFFVFFLSVWRIKNG